MTAKRPVHRLTAERLREVVSYNPETGIFRWRSTSRRKKAGEIAGTCSLGRNRIQIDGCRQLASVLAWLYVYGRWPVGTVDHKDRNHANDRFANLRECTDTQNNMNREVSAGVSGFVGVTRDARRRRQWCARVSVEKRRVSLGYFATQAEAAAVVRAENARLYGEFARKE